MHFTPDLLAAFVFPSVPIVRCHKRGGKVFEEKNTKSIFPAGVYAVPAERQEPGGSGPGGRDTAHGARALRSESFLYFCCCLEGVMQDFCGGEGLLFILETARYQTLHTNPLRCWVTLGPTSCLQAQRDPGVCFGRFPGSRQPLGCWK